MFPIKYIDNNLVWNKDNEVFAYYELIPYNYSFLSAEQKFPGGFCADRAWKEMLLFSCRGTESCFFRRKKRKRTIAAWR